ncbi:MAG TPA: xanthine dehydrogenase family protein subunit M [Syntrophales bacterium]|nr:xanthine dehydrogenase family protein subunit M [Syntrophales bacterium]
MSRALKPFEYVEAGSVEEAAGVLSTWGGKARVLAGGVSLINDMRRRVVTPECVVSIRALPGIGLIQGDGVRGLGIGAMVTLRAAEAFLSIKSDYLALYEGIAHIPSLQVKSMATVVGNLCVASPASDVAPPLIAMGGQVRMEGTSGYRTLPLEDFFLGVNQTALGPGELVTQVSVPAPGSGSGGAFMRLARTPTDVAKLNVAVMMRVVDGVCREVRIALGAVAPRPVRARKAEEALRGRKVAGERIAAAAEAACGDISPISDIRSTVEYRKEMTKLLVKKALEKALERAGG